MVTFIIVVRSKNTLGWLPSNLRLVIFLSLLKVDKHRNLTGYSCLQWESELL